MIWKYFEEKTEEIAQGKIKPILGADAAQAELDDDFSNYDDLGLVDVGMLLPSIEDGESTEDDDLDLDLGDLGDDFGDDDDDEEDGGETKSSLSSLLEDDDDEVSDDAVAEDEVSDDSEDESEMSLDDLAAQEEEADENEEEDN